MSAARPRLVLASASASRRRVLTAAGLEFEVLPSTFEEVWSQDGDPVATVLELARGKALDVARLRPDSFVLGCDSLFSFGGGLLGKVGTEEEVAARWRAMGGSSGVLHTGHVLVLSGELEQEAVASTVHFARPTEGELAAYVATRESIGVAGSFTLEGRSSAFITAVAGDAGNVLGVSVAAVRRLLARFGVPISAFWR